MNRNLRELQQHLSERINEPMPTVDDILKDTVDSQGHHEMEFDDRQREYGEGYYDLDYLDRVVLLREIERLRAKLAGALTSQREDGASVDVWTERP
mgnify:CR=1 FL=1